MKRTWIWSALAVASVASAVVGTWPQATAGDDAKKPAYVGADVCKKCHFKQFSSWKKTPMFSAFDHLKAGESADKKTAAKLDPAKDYTKDPACLKCHATGYGTETGYPAVVEGKAWTKEEEDRAKLTSAGICEACHGPGSLYSPFKTTEHKDYKLAEIRALGLVTPLKAENCAECHKKGGCPTMPADYAFDFEAAKKKANGTHDHVPLKEKHE